MKRITKLLVLSLLLIVGLCTSVTTTYAQLGPPQKHFFIHGWAAHASSMDNIANDMHTRFNWASYNRIPDYLSFMLYGCGVACLDNTPGGVHPQLSASGESNYVGLGYSLGGLISRYEAATYGSTFIAGLVTTHTPNEGVYLADYGHRAAFIPAITNAEQEMLRGSWGWFTYFAPFATVALGIIIDGILQVLNIYGTIAFGGVATDMAPGSGFLTTLDSSSPPGVKEVALWGNTQWPYFAYYTSDDAGKSWWADYHAAEQASHDYDQSANNIESNISGWDYLVPGYAEAEWAAVWSNRSRAGDWSATCAGMVDEEGAWEKATCDAFIGGGSLAGGDGQSDGLVAISSQKAIPSPATILRDNGSCGCNTNHGDAIAKDDAGHTIRQNVYIALTTAGALHN